MTPIDAAMHNETDADASKYFIAINGPEKCKLVDEFKVRGKFRVPYEQDGITVQGSQVLKHIIMVVTRSGNYQASPPFKDVVIFDDDVKDDGNGCSGIFNINIADHIEFDDEGDYYILCSLGTYLSNTVKITI